MHTITAVQAETVNHGPAGHIHLFFFFFFSNGSRGRWFSGQAAPPAVSEEATATNSPSAKPPAASGKCVLVCLYTVFKSLQHGHP